MHVQLWHNRVTTYKGPPSRDECQSRSQGHVSSAEESNNIQISNGSMIIEHIDHLMDAEHFEDAFFLTESGLRLIEQFEAASGMASCWTSTPPTSSTRRRSPPP